MFLSALLRISCSLAASRAASQRALLPANVACAVLQQDVFRTLHTAGRLLFRQHGIQLKVAVPAPFVFVQVAVPADFAPEFHHFPP